jgi:hypothetical protein
MKAVVIDKDGALVLEISYNSDDYYMLTYCGNVTEKAYSLVCPLCPSITMTRGDDFIILSVAEHTRFLPRIYSIKSLIS